MSPQIPEAPKPAPAPEKPTAAQSYSEKDPTRRAAADAIEQSVNQGHTDQLTMAHSIADKAKQRDTIKAEMDALKNNPLRPAEEDAWWSEPEGGTGFLAGQVTPAKVEAKIREKSDLLQQAGLLDAKIGEANIAILTNVLGKLLKEFFTKGPENQDTAKTKLLPKFTNFLEKFNSILGKPEYHFANLKDILIAFAEFIKIGFIDGNGLFKEAELTQILKYDNATLENWLTEFIKYLDLKKKYETVCAQIINQTPVTPANAPAVAKAPTPPAQTPPAKSPELSTTSTPEVKPPTSESLDYKGLLTGSKTIELPPTTPPATAAQTLENIKTQLASIISPILNPTKKDEISKKLAEKIQGFINTNNIKFPDGVNVNPDGTLTKRNAAEEDAKKAKIIEDAKKAAEANKPAEDELPTMAEIADILKTGSIGVLLQRLMSYIGKMFGFDFGGKIKQIPEVIDKTLKDWPTPPNDETRERIGDFLKAISSIPDLKNLPPNRLEPLFKDPNRTPKVLAAIKPTIGPLDLTKFLDKNEIADLMNPNKPLSAAELETMFTSKVAPAAAPTPPATPIA